MEIKATISELIDQIYVFRRMLDQLPPEISEMLNDQFSKICTIFQNSYNKNLEDIKNHVLDVEVAVAYLEFDLAATTRERDALK